MSYKPDLTKAVTVRCSKETRTRIASVCRRDDLSESEAIRYLLEAGLEIAEQGGIGTLMETRSASLQKAANTAKAARRLKRA